MENFVKQTKKVSQWLLGAMVLFGLAACGQKDDAVLKVGATVGPHAQVGHDFLGRSFPPT